MRRFEEKRQEGLKGRDKWSKEKDKRGQKDGMDEAKRRDGRQSSRT